MSQLLKRLLLTSLVLTPLACSNTDRVDELEAQVNGLQADAQHTRGMEVLAELMPYISKRVRCGLDVNDNVIAGANCIGLDVSFGIDADQLGVLVKVFDTPPDYGWPWAIANIFDTTMDVLVNPTFWLGGTSVTLANRDDDGGDRYENSYNTSKSNETTNASAVNVSESLNAQSLTDTTEFGDFENIGNTDKSSTKTATESYNDNSDNSKYEDTGGY